MHASRDEDSQAQRDLDIALGCAVGFALLVFLALIIYLWTR
jgi:hypothetical protein